MAWGGLWDKEQDGAGEKKGVWVGREGESDGCGWEERERVRGMGGRRGREWGVVGRRGREWGCGWAGEWGGWEKRKRVRGVGGRRGREWGCGWAERERVVGGRRVKGVGGGEGE